MKTFELIRETDVSGVSGVGKVAEGVVFANGLVVIAWCKHIASATTYTSIEDCIAIHGHEGATKFKFN
jgi:hypothetical protein